MSKFFLFLILVSSLNTFGQYNFLGASFQEDNAYNSFVITPDQAGSTGAFWYINPINLEDDFELVANLFLGCDTSANTGGDGIAFVIQNNGNNQPNSPNGGGELGYGGLGPQNGINPSLAIQFDTYTDNAVDYPTINDPLYDHVGLMKNGSIEHNSIDDLLTVPFNNTLTDVEDCENFFNQQITIKWTAQDTNLVLLYCNGISSVDTLIDIKYNIKNEIFSSNEIVYIGFTGSTGSATNLQKVEITYFDKEPIMKDQNICSNETIEYDLSYLTNYSFQWIDQNGNLLSDSSIFVVNNNEVSTYNLILTNNCTEISYSEFFTLTPITVNLEEDLNLHQDINCNGDSTGQIVVNYSNSGIGTLFQINGINQTSNTFANLYEGFYTITVSDQFNCSDTITSEIVSPNSNLSITQSIENQILICIDGGIPPYQLNYSNANINNIDSCIIIEECIGNFNLIIQDSLMCTDSINLELLPTQAYIDQNNSEVIIEQAYYPLSFQWFLNNELIESEMDSIFSTGLCPGSYECLIKNRLGCQNSLNINIENLQSNINKQIDCTNQDFSKIETNVTGGTAPYQYLWNTNSTNSFIENIDPIEYSVKITDNNNCTIEDQLTVPELTDSCLYNAFSPNNDGTNDQWIVNSSFLPNDSKLSIYNRWGKKVFQTSTKPYIFEGKNNNGKDLVEGTYFYTIQSGEKNFLKGTLSLYR